MPDQTPTTVKPKLSYGWDIPPSQWRRHAVIGQPEASGAGNLVLRVGLVNDDGDGWQQTEHLVLSPSEATAFLTACHRLGFDPEAPR